MEFSDNESDNDIVGCKKQPRYTSPDHRAKLALNADEVTQLRALCKLIDDEEEFQYHLLLLFTSLYVLKMNNEFSDDDDSSSSNDEDDNSDDDSSTSSNCYSSNDDYNSSSNDSTYTTSDDDSTSTGSDITMETNDSTDCSSYDILIETFAMILGCSILELDHCCNQIIDLTAIRRHEWDSVQRRHDAPKMNRTIDELGSSNCYDYTRFTQEELKEILFLMFGHFPSASYVVKEHRFTFEETLIIALHYMANGTKYSEMHSIYGGNSSKYSLMINWFAKFLYHKYYHRLCGHSLEYWVPDVSIFRKAIWKYVCFDKDEKQDVNVMFEQFRVFGWIDCMQNFMNQPGSGPINEEDDRRNDVFFLQRAFYTKYGKGWGMKSQLVAFPNGMIGSVYFTSLAQNDKGCTNISGIEEAIERVLIDERLNNNQYFPVLYADLIYEPSTTIVRKPQRMVNDLFHKRLDTARVDIEHIIGGNAKLWKRIRTKHTWKLLSLKDTVREHLFSIFFMTNIHSCFRGNKTATKFNLSTPTASEYLRVNANHSYDGPGADLTMIALLQTEQLGI